MFRSRRVYIYFFLVVFPVVTFLLGKINESAGLIWLALDTVYYYPVYLISAPLFHRLEMGLLVPSLGGRLLAFGLYTIFYFLFLRLKTGLYKKKKEGL